MRKAADVTGKNGCTKKRNGVRDGSAPQLHGQNELMNGMRSTIPRIPANANSNLKIMLDYSKARRQLGISHKSHRPTTNGLGNCSGKSGSAMQDLPSRIMSDTSRNTTLRRRHW